MKSSGDRASSNITVALSPAEIDVLNAYCASKGWSRTYVIRRVIRLLKNDELGTAALEFRTLKAALPPLEDQ